MTCKYNFSAGPSLIPKEVLEQVHNELFDYNSTGMSVMEMSHRSKQYLPIIEQAEEDLRALLAIPKNYKVLFLQGGAITQNFMVPMNLLNGRSASYVASGYWSKRTYTDAQAFGQIKMAASSESIDFIKAPSFDTWDYSTEDAYVHFCLNETIHGVEYFNNPLISDIPIVCDMSSNILSRNIEVDKYGVIYAGAQKNIGPAGLTMVIINKEFMKNDNPELPNILRYSKHSESDSMLNTPPTFSWYMAGKVFKWIKRSGGLEFFRDQNHKKAETLYSFIDNSSFYSNPVDVENRSIMNIPFILADSKLDSVFLKEAEDNGLLNLKGHRSVGGMRASIYNAMPLEGVNQLVDFMKVFEAKYG